MQRYLASMEGAVLSGRLCAEAIDTAARAGNIGAGSTGISVALAPV
jgi:uncharacterized protein with NAD-binding domain and iron-sulfur cluster